MKDKSNKKKIKRYFNKGLTIVEVVISFSVSLILLLAMLSIVYWGSNISTINQKFTDVANVLNFIGYEIQNNTASYFYIDNNTNNLVLRDNAVNTLYQTLKNNGYKIGNSYDYTIDSISFSKYGNSNTLYEVVVNISYFHKGSRRRINVSWIVSITNLQIRAINNNFPDNDINPADTTNVSGPGTTTTIRIR